ncbi:MAG: hypothetical protein K9W45_11070 [Candidatus Heimdallarchaeum aukensis]|uniref:Uncharacterized protein n=1 Tax=Candidatus Heimdallarchaeum aukensis TaxID=2876573 RepID=A0A9Y1BLB9_9ARCH|nr:MAG: hypothetical protein K9W45_11070 [Candidatus Heimdallarchaeum aukensis]
MESLILFELSREEAITLHKFLLRINKQGSIIFQNQKEKELISELSNLLEQELK